MKIVDLLLEKQKNPLAKTPKIAFFGDSVTEGCFELYNDENGCHQTITEPENGYHEKFKYILKEIFKDTDFEIIRAGVSGNTTNGGLSRIEKDILDKKPDLTVVCFGLNDCVRREEGLEPYKNNIAEIISRIKNVGSEVIFMTPNMMATKVCDCIEQENIRNLAKICSDVQNDGILEMYLNEAKKIAIENGCKVCDVYSKWKRFYDSGLDINTLFSNAINHPTRNMHYLFAYSLLDTIFE